MTDTTATFDAWREALVNKLAEHEMNGWGDDRLSDASVEVASEMLDQIGFGNPAEWDEPRMGELRGVIQSLVAIAQVATGVAQVKVEKL